MMRWSAGLSAVLGLGLGVVVACGGGSEVEQTRSIATKRVSFDYPASWALDSAQGRNEGLFSGVHAVSGGASARVVVKAYDAQAPFSAADVADMFIDDLRRQQDGSSVEVTGRGPARATIGGISVEGAQVRLDRTTGGAAVAHTVEAFTVQTDKRIATVVVQVADADRAAEGPGIERVLGSLKLY